MKNILAPALVVTAMLAVGGGMAGAADPVLLRTAVTPEEAWIGQRVLLHIEVLGADGWAQISDMAELEIPGTYVLRTDSHGVRLSETIGRTAYTGQRYPFSIYCQRPGRVEIPALPVKVKVKQWGYNAGEIPYELKTPATALVCKVPPGAEGVRGLISTTLLEANQSWSSEPEEVAPGDALTRQVTVSAVDVSGMAFPPLQHSDLEGLSIYPGEPSVTDETGRGSLRGERVETVTYVLEQPGEVVLPVIVLPWWDIDDQVLRRIELQGLTLKVVGELAPEPVTEAVAAPLDPPRDRLLRAAAVLALVVLAVWLGRRLARGYGRWWRARQESEPAYFRRVKAALPGGDPVLITSAIMQWLDRRDPGKRPARLDLFLQDHGDDETRAAASALAQCLAAGETYAEARTLSRGLRQARSRLQRSRHHEHMAAGVLPELNGRRP